MSAFLSDVLDKALPFELDEVLGRILGGTIPASNGQFNVAAWGRFGGHLTNDLLALTGNPKTVGALILAEADTERVLYMQEGAVIGSASNVLFEQLGRILYQAEVVTHADSEALVAAEDAAGGAALLDWLPERVLAWAVRRRVEAVAAALPFIRKGHFVWVEGEVDLQGLPLLSLPVGAVGAEARRLYDVWRHGESGASGEETPPADVPLPLAGPLSPRQGREEAVEDLFRRIRESDLGFK